MRWRWPKTGPEGLQVARKWRPDVLLLDIGLPGLDGYDVARRLRTLPLGEEGPCCATIRLQLDAVSHGDLPALEYDAAALEEV